LNVIGCNKKKKKELVPYFENKKKKGREKCLEKGPSITIWGKKSNRERGEWKGGGKKKEIAFVLSLWF